jgi:beta-phosphoglucomutase-like phosphatase (HAD superfamily)
MSVRLSLLMAVSLSLSALASPAFAQEDRCSALAAQVEKAIAGTQDAKNIRRAQRMRSDAQMICASGNERAAVQKFNQALKLLNAPPQ